MAAKYFTIYEVVPAPYGDDYRPIITRDRLEDTIDIAKFLEKTNINFELYQIIDEEGMRYKHYDIL